MIPFYLVTGFLGSGKTTLLKNLLHHNDGKERLAIIQNEFAPSGTDGTELLLEGKDFRLVEVNNGSVFCVCMLGSFAGSLAKVIREYRPDRIILEASGLSDPINILELLQDPEISNAVSLEKIITIVDASTFHQAMTMLNRTRHQVMIADILLLNKTDLASVSIEEVSANLKEINPFAKILPTSYCRELQWWERVHASNTHPSAETFGQKTSEGRPGIKACVLRTNDRMPAAKIDRFSHDMQEYSIRFKGYLNSREGQVYMIQSVFGHAEKRAVSGYMGPTEIIAFGEDLTPKILKEIYGECCVK